MSDLTESPAPPSPETTDPWRHLSRLTPARIALGRVGAGLPTREVLSFALAHARACDAVHAAFDGDGVAAGLAALGLETVRVTSAAPSREVYLRRPDLGRRLSAESRAKLERRPEVKPDIALVVADGLSASAVHAHAVPLIGTLLPRFSDAGWSLGPVAVADQARVALGDEIGAVLVARLVLVLIGERPGLSSPDSLGAYLTFAPRVGRTDAERNCVSNIRTAGLDYAAAAHKLVWLIGEAFRISVTGVELKDESHLIPVTAPLPTFPSQG